MINQKYYCAWHPERGLDLRTICENEGACKHEAIYHIIGDSVINPLKYLESQGWQVKEVVIVDADFITELKNYMISNGMELPNILQEATDGKK